MKSRLAESGVEVGGVVEEVVIGVYGEEDVMVVEKVEFLERERERGEGENLSYWGLGSIVIILLVQL